jgi:hypothetical protein
MIAKCYEIVDVREAPLPSGSEDRGVREYLHVNRVTDISFRLHDHMFFYMPQVLVKKTYYYRDPHFWSFFAMHDLRRNVEEMRSFAQQMMLNMIQFVKPVNSVEPYIHDAVTRVS